MSQMTTESLQVCIYEAVGCNSDCYDPKSILEHLQHEAVEHSQLLLQYVHNLSIEINVLKANLITPSPTNEFSMKKQIEEIIEQMLTQKVTYADGIFKIQRQFDGIKTELKGEINCLKEDCENKAMRIVALEKDAEEKNNRIAILEQRLSEMINGMAEEREERMRCAKDGRREMDRMNNYCGMEVARMEEKIIVSRKEVNDLKDKIERSHHFLDKAELRRRKLCLAMNVDCVWRVEGYSRRRRGVWLHSDGFYADYYKLCLSLRIQEEGNVCLRCCVMNDDEDEKVQWPMRHKVTLSIINQDSTKAHWSVTYRYNWSRFGIADGSDTECLSIKDNPFIIANDSIVVSCVLNDP